MSLLFKKFEVEVGQLHFDVAQLLKDNALTIAAENELIIGADKVCLWPTGANN